MITPPDQSEYAEYYRTYTSQVPAGDIRHNLESQATETLKLLRGISEERSMHRYAPGKWTIREVASHINDTERLFVSRAFWFARRFDSPLPDFDQEIALAASSAHDIPWARHVAEFGAVRAATTHFFRNLTDAAWSRSGIAGGNPFTVRALAWITAGHVAHHIGLVKERYL